MPNGCGNSGEYLDQSKVTTKTDYILNGVHVEVKVNSNLYSIFHIKEDQVKSYIRQNGFILYVNGWYTPSPVFTIITKEQMQYIVSNFRIAPYWKWGDKLCYTLKARDYKWQKF